MARRPLTKPRKLASQQRSRATVEALLDATARILVKEGYDKMSTNRIAAVAGVSVGSLYQYFPGKEALVVALAERHQWEIMQLVRQRVAGTRDLPLNASVRTIAAAALAAHQIDPPLHCVLSEQIPRVGKLEKLAQFSGENFTLFRNYLEAHRSEVAVDDLELASFVCVTAIESLTHNAVLYGAQHLAGHRAERLVTHITHLVTAYLRGESALSAALGESHQ